VIVHDYCCCAGLGADGYAAVLGASVIKGFDHEPQPDYPYEFEKADVMRMLVYGLPPATLRHFSFPCQIHTTADHLRTAQGGKSKYFDLLTPGLAIIREHYNDTPWVIENVDDRSGNVRRIMAPREGETLIMLCGSMFGLQVQRHRLFLANFPLRQPAPTGPGVYGSRGCRHDTFPTGPKGRPKPIGVYHVPGDKVPEGGHTARDAEHGRQVMGSHRLLPWDKLKEGFPPAYTSWVGADLLRHLERAS
jgi:DNA (cytosine-5)-methyltransferase 1